MIVELTTGLLALYSAFLASPATSAQSTTPALPDGKSDVPAVESVEELPTLSDREKMIKQVEAYFGDAPILVEIAKCESSLMQHTDDGELVRGRVNKYDVGIMQINVLYHEKTAKALGFDLETLEGNMAYAKYLYEKQGVKPWLSSSKCWMKSDTYKALSQS